MRTFAAFATVRFACVLPDDDNEADAAFDRICEAIEDAVSQVRGIFDESVNITDANTIAPPTTERTP